MLSLELVSFELAVTIWYMILRVLIKNGNYFILIT